MELTACDALDQLAARAFDGYIVREPVRNSVSVAELAVEKGATMLLIPITARRQLNDQSDEMAMRLSIIFYSDAREALIKALGD